MGHFARTYGIFYNIFHEIVEEQRRHPDKSDFRIIFIIGLNSSGITNLCRSDISLDQMLFLLENFQIPAAPEEIAEIVGKVKDHLLHIFFLSPLSQRVNQIECIQEKMGADLQLEIGKLHLFPVQLLLVDFNLQILYSICHLIEGLEGMFILDRVGLLCDTAIQIAVSEAFLGLIQDP